MVEPEAVTMRMTCAKFYLLPIVGAVGVITLGFPGCKQSRPEATSADRVAPLAIQVALVERTVSAQFQPVAGTVRPFERATVAARIMGTVTGAEFSIGQKVSAGEVLLTLQANELNARLEQARANFDQAARELTRERGLVSQGASTEETVRLAEDRWRITKAAFEEAEVLVSYTRVAAPFPGYIKRKLINTGDFSQPGVALFEIEARDRMRAEIEVPDTLPSLPLDATVRVVTSAGTVAGRIGEISTAVHPATRTRSVVIKLPSGTTVHSGEFVRVLWPAGETPVLLVPAEAVRLFGQIEQTFVVQDGHASLRIVKVGPRENGRVQVLAGLDAGETVARSPPVTLRDGQAVQVLP